jgi:predicted transcriptional regulator
LVYGFKSEVPSALRETHKVQYNCGDYLAELRGRLQSTHEVARQKLISSKERSMEYYDKNSETMEIQTDQKVSLFDESVRRGGPKT